MKKKIKKILTILLAILLIAVIQITGTIYAKYIASEKATGSAEIAKWSFQIVKNGEETKKIKLVDTTDKNTLKNGKIAPGTCGYVTLELDATGSEVDLDYTVEFRNEKNKPTNMIFTYLSQRYSKLSDIGKIQGKIGHSEENKVKSILVAWEWPYQKGIMFDEQTKNNEIDTQDANTLTEYTFDVVVTATQSD